MSRSQLNPLEESQFRYAVALTRAQQAYGSENLDKLMADYETLKLSDRYLLIAYYAQRAQNRLLTLDLNTQMLTELAITKVAETDPGVADLLQSERAKSNA